MSDPPDIPCLVIAGQSCGVVRGASTGKRLYHYECVVAFWHERIVMEEGRCLHECEYEAAASIDGSTP